MGSGMADALVRGGVRVVATLEGRSARTTRLADRADMYGGGSKSRGGMTD